jgi:hypothetical protein
MKSIFLLFSALYLSFGLYGQINGYARITSISGTTLNVSNVNQTYHNFIVGNWVVIMQMQDNVIGTNTGENTSFGNLSTINRAGLYEIRQILSVNGNSTVGYSTASPTSIGVSNLTNAYVTSANSSAQVITFRNMSATNYTTTANITALPWDGNVGGVIAMEVPGILTLNHNITADGVGFRGGAVSNDYAGGTCFTNPYRANDPNAGFKGEGIYKRTSTTYLNGRAKIISGGGGGVSENGGGGGGSNYTAGGNGGGGYNGSANGCTGNAGYGFGGVALGAYVASNRIFMGGGGGGGQQNNSVASAGGNGGGIIIIKAGTIRTTGSCGERVISANGASSSLAGNDGAGGGGAAGTIVFDVGTWSINGACDLRIAANGGDGGSVNSVSHGGGGAGAQGVVQFSAAQPTSNITTTTLNGTPGCNNNSNPCNNPAGSASGANNSGIQTGINNPLPIELVYFGLTEIDGEMILLNWQTSSEKNNDYFIVDRSLDGENWEEMVQIKGAGNSVDLLNYEWLDERPLKGTSYYRLKQVDFDGNFKFHGIRSASREGGEIIIFPNPAEDIINFQGPKGSFDGFEVYDFLGNNLMSTFEIISISNEYVILNIAQLAKGIYFLKTADSIIKFVKN